jgi:hypothetical protein
MLHYVPVTKGKLNAASSNALKKALTLRETRKNQGLLSFGNLVNKLRERIKKFPDRRRGKNRRGRGENSQMEREASGSG